MSEKDRKDETPLALEEREGKYYQLLLELFTRREAFRTKKDPIDLLYFII